tara:strand:- start:302 stop:1693 length:1392 start_codon:yes stop_codon:yes gene_type:complete
MSLNPTLFRDYDIRGVYNETLFDDDAYKIGAGFGLILKDKTGHEAPTISVCYDGRLSSPALKNKLINGLLSQGIHVIELGLATSPLSYFSSYHLNVDATIIVTGSHSPKNYNGFKFTINHEPFFSDDIQNLKIIIETHKFETTTLGTHLEQDIKQDYITDLISRFPSLNPDLKIAWDCGNGSVGALINQFTAQSTGEHFVLFDEVDGNFPNHHPDPTIEKNLKDLKNTVLSKKCDIGIAFDGDGDRIGVLDDQGDPLWCDDLITLLAYGILKDNQGAKIVADIKCSSALFDCVNAWCGQGIIWKSGHSNVRYKMNETGALLGGELSGHIFFKDKFKGYDDALYCALRLIELLSKTGKPLSELRKIIPSRIITPEYRIKVDETQKFKLIEQITDTIKTLNGWEYLEIDGVRAYNEKGWFLVRASNTENKISLRIEATSTNNLEEIKSLIHDIAKKTGIPLLQEI